MYGLLLKILHLEKDFRQNPRHSLGISPYLRRSPLLLLVLNIQELFIFFRQPRFRSNKYKTDLLRDTRKDSIALVIGNGPSSKKLDYKKVNAENPDIWVVNDFYKMDPDNLLNITHYVLSDPEYFKLDSNGRNERLSAVLNYINDKSVTLVIPHVVIGNKLILEIAGENVIFFDDRELSAWSRNIYPNKPRGYIGLTLYKALGFALFLGYRKIYIIGMDNSEFLKYSSDHENRLLLLGNHAYLDSKKHLDLSEHYLDGLAGALMHYSHVLGDLSKFHGPIINLDPESLTTAFKKVRAHHWMT